MIERVKRWFVSCGAGRVGRRGMRVQSIVGRTRNPRVLLYRSRFVSRFGKLRHHNSARLARTKAEDSAPNLYPLAQKIDATSPENHRKPSQVDGISTKNRSWPVFGVQSRFGDVSGRVRDATGARQSRPKSDLGTPRACQEWPGDVQERARDGPKTPPGPSGAMSECVRRDKQSRTRHRNVF